MRRFQYGTRLAVALAAATLLAAGCGGGSETSSNAAPASAAGTQADASAPESARNADRQGGSGTGGPDRAKVTNSPAPVEVTAQPRAIIYVAEMTVRAKDVPAASETAKRIVTAAQGYLAREESDSFNAGEASATLVFKVPPAAYPAVLARLGGELGERESVQQNTEDVTEEVADVESRLKSSQAALDSLRTLLGRADTIGEVLQVEREVRDREAELESLQARQKSLAAQTGMATVTLRLIGPVAAVPEPEEEPSGFLAGLASGWTGLVGFLKALLTVVGVLLPWMIVIVPVVVGVLLLVRRARRGRPAPAAPPAREPDPEPEPEPLRVGPPAEDPGRE